MNELHKRIRLIDQNEDVVMNPVACCQNVNLLMKTLVGVMLNYLET